MLPYRDSRLTTIALLIFFLLALGYAIFEAQGFIFGPVINVQTSLTNVQTQFIIIKGQAERITSLSMNGAPIPVTQTGEFSAPYLLAPGYNRIVLDAKDAWGRTREKAIEIMYTPASSTPVQSASSTPLSASSSATIATSTTAGTSSSAVAPGQ